MNSLFPLLSWRIDGYPGEHTACDRMSVMKRQYRGCSALHLTCNQYAVYEAENDAVQLHYISPHAENENEPTVHFSCGPQMRITQQPVTRSGEWDIKIRRLGCTSSRCVAVWQRVLICCVVCGALGQMCPLCTRLRALSTWAGVKRRTGRLKSFHQVEYSHQYECFLILFHLHYTEKLLNVIIEDHVQMII